MWKLKILKSKRGVNDISIAGGIIALFVLLGIFLPFINAEFGTASGNNDVDNLESDVGETSPSAVNAFSIIGSVFAMFFWTFGALPFWLDGIFIILRIVLALIIARNIWIGGGG